MIETIVIDDFSLGILVGLMWLIVFVASYAINSYVEGSYIVPKRKKNRKDEKQ